MYNNSECTLWEGKPNQGGYGRKQVKINGVWKTQYAHRWAWEQVNGRIPDGLTIDHLCLTKLCVNTLHMEVVTLAENLRRKHARITHCPQGHKYDDKNTLIKKTGSRHCRACNRDRMRLNRKKDE